MMHGIGNYLKWKVSILMKIRIAGYAKLAKLWEKNREQAIKYHTNYFSQKYNNNNSVELVGVYIDITGNSETKKRPEMIRLLSDCLDKKIDQIAIQTKGYLAANTRELCYLIKFLFDLDPPIHLLSYDVDYHIDTLQNEEHQREELHRMANNYCNLNTSDYSRWKREVKEAILDSREREKHNG